MINVVKLRDNKGFIMAFILLILFLVLIGEFFNRYEIVPIEKTKVEKSTVKEPTLNKPLIKEEKIETKQDVKINIDVEKIIEKSKPNVYNINITNPIKETKKSSKDNNLETAIKTINELDSLYEELK